MYTLETWGSRQADRYIESLKACFQDLADHPGLGRNCDAIHPSLKRMEHARHSIYFLPKPYGIRIARILHQTMLPDRQILNE